MPSESIISLELAVGAAALVLTARLVALIQATRGVPAAQSQLVSAINGGDLDGFRRKTKGLGHRNPYGEVAADLLRADEGDDGEPSRRAEVVARSAEFAKKRMLRRTQQGQAADFSALTFAGAVVFFASGTLPDGPIFWSLSGAVVVLLLFSLLVRSQLQATVLTSLDALKTALIARPELPSLSGEAVDCLWCGGITERHDYSLQRGDESESEHVEATICANCGKFVATLVGVDEPSSSD